jgi:hypothetical protein
MFCLAALASTPGLAQVTFTGSVYVKVLDESGNPIQGATAKLTGRDYSRELTTSSDGSGRFGGLFPEAYELEISATGYNTMVYPKVTVDTLQNVALDITMQKSTTVERVVVTAETPLLDARNSGGQNTVLTQTEIQAVPTARDPWAVLQTVPGAMSDRINVGGNEAGQQAVFVGNGDDGEQSTWVMDGVDFTDNAAEGATSSYLDFNAFEQISFVTGAADIEQQSPGLRLNFVQKQGSNQTSGTARLIYTDNGLQEDAFRTGVENPTTGESTDVNGDSVTQIFEKNFDVGGAFYRDYLWWWFGFTQNDIDVSLASGDDPDVPGTADKTQLQNISIKLHGQFLGKGTYRLFWTQGDKLKDGRTAVPNRSAETTWDQAGTSLITSGEISYFFTPNVEVAAQISEVAGGFGLTPKAGSGPGTQMIVDESGTWVNTFQDFSTQRPTEQWAIRANWFTSTGSWDHELKFGYKYRKADRSSTSLYGGDGILAFEGPGGVGGSANVYRIGDFTDRTEHQNLWVGDTILNGPWAINFGLHYSNQTGEQLAGTVPGNPLNSDPTTGGIPGIDFTGFDPGVTWSDLMVRAGATYTFGKSKRTLIRFNFAQYVDTIANGDVGYNNPIAPSSVNYDWDDTNGDVLVQFSELDTTVVNFTTNYDPSNPTAASSPDAINPDLKAPNVNEFSLGAEYELLPNFTIGGNYTYRVRQDEIYLPLYDSSQFNSLTQTGNLVPLSPEIYQMGTMPYNNNDFGLSGSLPVYFLPASAIDDSAFGSRSASTTTGGRGTVRTNDPRMEQEFNGLSVNFTKRLSNKWMLRGFLGYYTWKKNFSGSGLIGSSSIFSNPPSNSFVVPGGDPTNQETDTTVDGSDVAYQSAGSGPTSDIWPGSSRWTFNFNGMYQLPKAWYISGNLTGREGYKIPLMVINTDVGVSGDDVFSEGVSDGDLQTPQKAVQVGSFDDTSYEDIFQLDFKVAKLFKLGGDTTVELAGEMFNVGNADTALTVTRSINNAQGDDYGNINKVISPRIVRFLATINF